MNPTDPDREDKESAQRAPREGEGAPPSPQPEDIVSGLRYLHLMEAQTKARVSELSANLNALIEVLIGEGHVPLEAYEKRKRLAIVRENERATSEAQIEVADMPDKYSLTDLPNIDCASLLHLCKARCCSLTFALSVQDLDERVVRWNYGRPYQIAQREDGYCVHNEAGRCSIYKNRPGICRSYDCRNDKRIWEDFDKRIPAP
jgi:Fe-S-cluster containining protein